jgi:hypothetical protein
MEIRPANEIATDRATAVKNKQKEISKRYSYGQKIHTEANDGLSMNYQQKELIMQENTSNRNIFTNDDNYELNERINILKQLVNKAPKLNLEVILF